MLGQGDCIVPSVDSTNGEKAKDSTEWKGTTPHDIANWA
jgi:hypothetical protein